MGYCECCNLDDATIETEQVGDLIVHKHVLGCDLARAEDRIVDLERTIKAQAVQINTLQKIVELDEGVIGAARKVAISLAAKLPEQPDTCPSCGKRFELDQYGNWSLIDGKWAHECGLIQDIR